MERLKASILVILAIMILSSCNNQQRSIDLQTMDESNKNEVERSDTIFLQKHEYVVLNDTLGVLDIEIPQEGSINWIMEAINPILIIDLGYKRVLAKGNFIFNSSIPEGCDYFFSIDNKGKIIIYNNVINLVEAQ